jgi:hypothetical protein
VITADLLSATVPLECETKSGPTLGTGFFFAYRNRLFVVTARHVVDGIIAGSFSLAPGKIEESRTYPAQGQPYTVSFSSKDFVGHPRQAIDVAVMDLSTIVLALRQRGTPAFWRALSEANLPSTEDFARFIGPLEDAIVLGYVSGLLDPSARVPIARRALTATPANGDIDGEPKFLIDASVWPGSSGSPVVLAREGSFRDRSGNAFVGDQLFLLGIIAQIVGLKEVDHIMLGPKRGKRLAITQRNQLIDLAIAYNHRAIIECLQAACEKPGVTVEARR